jgi:hypothetical protein
MKKIILATLVILMFGYCKPIPKFELPSTGNPPLVTYLKIIKTSNDKKSNYENVMKKFNELVPDAKIKNDDTGNCYFQMVGYVDYKYKGADHKCSYMLTFQGEDKQCSLTINQLKILHYNIERMYFDKKRKTAKKLNPSFEDINTKLNALMDELTKQLK